MNLELSPEQKRVEHLIAFSNRLSDDQWAYEGELVVHKGSQTWTVGGLIAWSRLEVKCQLHSDHLFGHALLANGSYGTFVAAEDYPALTDPSGQLVVAKAYPYSLEHRDNQEILRVRLNELWTGSVELDTPSRALILAGADLEDWPMMFPTADGLGARADGMVTTIFGRDALIRRMETGSEAGRDVLIAFDGPALAPDEQTAVWLVLSFISGRQTGFIGEIGFSAEGEVWRKRHRWNARPHAPLWPLQPHRWNRAALDLPKQLPGMFLEAQRLIQEDIPLDIALTHLFADSRGHLDVEIRDVTLSLDSLVEASAFKEDRSHIIDPKDYKALLPSINAAIESVIEGQPSHDEIAARLAERLRGANDISHGERRRKFWTRVGFSLKPDEKDALDNRHPMSHSGYILRGASDEEFQNVSDQVRLARNLVNRVILALLGYQGPVFDYTSGQTQPWEYFIERDGARKKGDKAESGPAQS